MMDENLKLENQLCFPLYAAARRVTGLYTPYLKPLGITYTQYLVFLVLWEEDDIPVGIISKKLYLDSGTLTPLLKKMERAGYVVRTRQQSDERVVCISLTEKGKDLKEACREIPEKIGGCLHMPAEDAIQLYQLLYQIMNSEEYGE